MKVWLTRTKDELLVKMHFTIPKLDQRAGVYNSPWAVLMAEEDFKTVTFKDSPVECSLLSKNKKVKL